MAKFSAHGSYALFVVGVTPTYYFIENITNSEEFQAKMQEVTDSGSRGWTEGLSGVNQASCSLACNDDDTAALDISGLQLGALGTLYVRRGTPEIFDVHTNSRFVGVSREANNRDGGPPELRINFMHGIATPGVAKASLPAGVRTYLQGLTPPRLTV